MLQPQPQALHPESWMKSCNNPTYTAYGWVLTAMPAITARYKQLIAPCVNSIQSWILLMTRPLTPTSKAPVLTI